MKDKDGGYEPNEGRRRFEEKQKEYAKHQNAQRARERMIRRQLRQPDPEKEKKSGTDRIPLWSI